MVFDRDYKPSKYRRAMYACAPRAKPSTTSSVTPPGARRPDEEETRAALLKRADEEVDRLLSLSFDLKAAGDEAGANAALAAAYALEVIWGGEPAVKGTARLRR